MQLAATNNALVRPVAPAFALPARGAQSRLARSPQLIRCARYGGVGAMLQRMDVGIACRRRTGGKPPRQLDLGFTSQCCSCSKIVRKTVKVDDPGTAPRKLERGTSKRKAEQGTQRVQRGAARGSGSSGSSKDQAYFNVTGYPFPLGPITQRATIRTDLVRGSIWGFEQPQSLGGSNVTTNVRMTVVRLKAGGLWVHAPIAPTRECMAGAVAQTALLRTQHPRCRCRHGCHLQQARRAVLSVTPACSCCTLLCCAMCCRRVCAHGS